MNIDLLVAYLEISRALLRPPFEVSRAKSRRWCLNVHCEPSQNPTAQRWAVHRLTTFLEGQEELKLRMQRPFAVDRLFYGTSELRQLVYLLLLRLLNDLQ